MRIKLFNLVGLLGERIVEGLRTFLEFFVNIHVSISELLIRTCAQFFKFMLWLIDSERIDHAEESIRQSRISAELEILMMVSSVKEDALSVGLWKENHSMALNELGSRLYDECEWEEEEIHRYMRMIVESIPGLTYAITDDEDDEEEGIRLEDR